MVTYVRPRDIGDAIRVLSDAGNTGRVLAGGTDLLVGVRRDPFASTALVDLKTANDLPPAVEVTAESVRFGPTATMADLSGDERITELFPTLVAAARVVGSIAIRNRATLVGNLCNGSPAADTAPALLVYGAVISIAGPDGVRKVALSEFFLGPGTTACGASEIVLSIELPIPAAGHCSAFQRLTRRRGVDLATVSAAVAVAPDGVIAMGLGAVGPTPLLAVSEPLADLGDTDHIDQVVDRLVSIATPISDIRASREYRQSMTSVLAKRAVNAALEASS